MLPRLTEYYLIEAVDLDRTWEAHKDKIAQRVGEGRHREVHVASHDHRDYNKSHMRTDVPANGPWATDTEAHEAARRVMKSNIESKYQYFDPNNAKGKERDLHAAANHPLKPTHTTWNDNHEVADRLRDAFSRSSAKPEFHGDKEAAEVKMNNAKSEFMDIVKAAAPHPKYIPTITKMYAEGSIKKIEDISTQAAQAFGDYHKLATHGRLDANKVIVHDNNATVAGAHSRPREGLDALTFAYGTKFKMVPETDFKRFRDLNDVRAVTQHPDHRKFLQGETKAAAKGSYTVVHDDDDVTVYHPHTWEASKALAVCPHTGQKAAWCTAADSVHGQRYFNDYSKEGALLIYHPKKPLHDGEMYQTHHASQQYMDENDEEVEYHHHSTKNGTNDLGIVKLQPGGEEEEHPLRSRFPGFNSKSALNYTYKHMYDHPEKYERTAPSHYTDENTGVMGVERGRVLKHTFDNHFHAQNPNNQDSGHWRPITSKEHAAAKAKDLAKGGNGFIGNMTLKDPEAHAAAKVHHAKVRAHFFGHDEEDDDR